MQITQDKKRSLFIKSYGCQMNEYDSERMIEILEKHNYSSVDEPRQADLIILNTFQSIIHISYSRGAFCK